MNIVCDPMESDALGEIGVQSPGHQMKLLLRDLAHCYPDIFILSGTTFSLLKHGPISG